MNSLVVYHLREVKGCIPGGKGSIILRYLQIELEDVFH